MAAQVLCPKCGSQKTMQIPDSVAFLCYVCKHEFTPDNCFLPKRLFINYGHDEHTTLALRLRDDLRARGLQICLLR
jgi:hypothetical protein